MMFKDQGVHANTLILPIILRVLIPYLNASVLLIDLDAGKVQARKPDADNCTVRVHDIESLGIVSMLSVDV